MNSAVYTIDDVACCAHNKSRAAQIHDIRIQLLPDL